MSRKELNISEALALFEELPSDTESIVSDESSDTEEYSIPEIIECGSNDEIIHENESVADDINLPGPSQPNIIRWEKRGKIQKTILNFDSETEPSDEILNMDDQSPIAIFSTVFCTVNGEHCFSEQPLCYTIWQEFLSPNFRGTDIIPCNQSNDGCKKAAKLQRLLVHIRYFA
ncbi:DDE_Tnp_1_7 domain-containing protein [Trichonephila clavipes]|nr:DDE_Tnp_1_7 domain-containing protein [Trichonephila clavipes]